MGVPHLRRTIRRSSMLVAAAVLLPVALLLVPVPAHPSTRAAAAPSDASHAVQVTAAQYAVASDTHWESQLVAQQ